MRPGVRFLSDELLQRIVAEGRDIICNLGVEINNEGIMSLLSDHGARVDKNKKRVWFTPDIIDKSLESVPAGFKLYDSLGNEAVDLSGSKVNYTPGSSGIYFLDAASGDCRRPGTTDYVNLSKLMCSMDHIASQSTSMVTSDVHERVSDSYRLYLSLMFCEKPVITGTFTIESFEAMKDLQLAIRGSREALKAKPLTVFSACPTAPVKWSEITSQNLVDCANWGIPVEYISMPLAGFMAPVTLVGSLIQHTAETLSGLAISQLTCPGAPILYGGSPAVFDVRYETTPMGAVGTMMIDCAYSEIGKYLGMPTQAYIGLSDAKDLDAQAGLESSMGATLAALSGINNISGPGMLDFENCICLEKLVLDNEICGMTQRMLEGITPRDDFPAQPRFEELMEEQHLLISDHTLAHIHEELYFPGPTIDRANRSRWTEEGSRTLKQRATDEVRRLLKEYVPIDLSEDIKGELNRIMMAEARKYGMDRLPETD